MFLKLKNINNEELKINTSFIVYIKDNEVCMFNNSKFYISDESIQSIDENIFGSDTTPVNNASEYTSSLLNDLHKLLGGKGDAKPTTDRKARLKARLKDFSDEELKEAAKNLGTDEFMQGANDNNKRYGTIDYLLRTSANVNKWLEYQPIKKQKSMF